MLLVFQINKLLVFQATGSVEAVQLKEATQELCPAGRNTEAVSRALAKTGVCIFVCGQEVKMVSCIYSSPCIYRYTATARGYLFEKGSKDVQAGIVISDELLTS